MPAKDSAKACIKWAVSTNPKSAETQLLEHFHFCLNKKENNDCPTVSMMHMRCRS